MNIGSLLTLDLATTSARTSICSLPSRLRRQDASPAPGVERKSAARTAAGVGDVARFARGPAAFRAGGGD